jgi:hypothetical protein
MGSNDPQSKEKKRSEAGAENGLVCCGDIVSRE